MVLRKKYDTIIFDLDGTLLDTLDDLAISTNYALRQMGYAERSREEIRAFVGNGVKKLIERAVPCGTSIEKTEEVLSIFKQYYAEHSDVHTKPYDGILALLDRLIAEGFRIAVVSNKLDSAVKTLCRRYFGDRILVAIGDKEGVAKKPAPDMVHEALAILYAHHFDAVYIGDSDVDVLTAENAKMDCISVTWGFRDEDFLAQSGASHIVHSPSEIFPLLFLNEFSPNI